MARCTWGQAFSGCRGTSPQPENSVALRAEVLKIVPRGVEVAFDAVGTRLERLKELMSLTDLGGATMAVGVLPMADDVPIAARDLLLGGRRLIGVRGGNGFAGLDIPRILKLYETGRLQLDELVGATYEMEDIADAFAVAARADYGRVVVRVAPSLL
jgi:S-(hydroxymethyl)glutathione dehydrogenase/alcohol dehydrogenase